MERLTMHSIVEVIYRLRNGRSERAIARDLRRHRATTRHYHEMSNEKGYLDPAAPLPSEEELLLEMGDPPQPSGTTSRTMRSSY